MYDNKTVIVDKFNHFCVNSVEEILSGITNSNKYWNVNTNTNTNILQFTLLNFDDLQNIVTNLKNSSSPDSINAEFIKNKNPYS